MRKPFMNSELAVIRQHFPDGGASACKPMLQGRSERSIQLFAWKQGIRRDMEKLNAKRRAFMELVNRSR